MKPFEFLRPDYCPNCKQERSLELYNSIDKPMNYSIMIDRNVDIHKKVIDLSYMKCKKCKKCFFPRWQDGKIYPLEPMNEHDFMSYFKSSYKK